MDAGKYGFPSILLLLLISSGMKGSDSARVFTIANECTGTVWPAVTPGDSFDGGGFALRPGQTVVFAAPTGWSGRIWARTGCSFDRAGNGTCETGACGTALKCGSSGATPATLAEFTLASPDFYDVSLVDGFNVPVTVRAVGGTGRCGQAGCVADLRDGCPAELSVREGGKTVACRSACDVFNTDEYCCRGNYGNPSECLPTFYSREFKRACPTAYSYAYDDPTSIFTCQNADYIVTFCDTGNQTVCTYHENKLRCNGGSHNRSASLVVWLIAIFISIANVRFGH